MAQHSRQQSGPAAPARGIARIPGALVAWTRRALPLLLVLAFAATAATQTIRPPKDPTRIKKTRVTEDVVTPAVATPANDANAAAPAVKAPSPAAEGGNTEKHAASRPAPESIVVTDAGVERSIRQGVAFLGQTQKEDGSWESRYNKQHAGGATALAALAMLSAGETVAGNPRLAAAVKFLDEFKPVSVYALSLRIMVYARLGAEYAPRLNADVSALALQQLAGGGWGYGVAHPITALNRTWSDNSNTLWATLALRDADDAGAPVPKGVWTKAQTYWLRGQNADGGWGYDTPAANPGAVSVRPESYGSMTAAGIASNLLLMDKAGNGSGLATATGAADKAGKWMASNYTAQAVPKWSLGGSWLYYYYYALSRAAAVSGWRNIGEHDWRMEVARELLSRQSDDGSWGDPTGEAGMEDPRRNAPVHTSLAILTLTEARRPLLFNKMNIGSPIAAGERDLAGLARLIGTDLKQPIGWQNLPAIPSRQQLAEAPLLFLRANGANISPEVLETLRQYIQDGGTVLVQAGDEATAGILGAAFAKLLPGTSAGKLPATHPVFQVKYKILKDYQPPCIGVGDRCRTQVFLVGDDLSKAWQSAVADTPSGLVKFGVNAALYATDMTAPQGKFDVRSETPRIEPKHLLHLARVKHDGGWNTCPKALARLGETLSDSVSLGIREDAPVDLAREVPATLPLLWMTGLDSFKLTAAQKQTLKAYLDAGGMLFVDSAVGGTEFAESAAALLKDMYGAVNLQPLPKHSPLISGMFNAGMGADIHKVAYNRSLPGKVLPELQAVVVSDRVVALFSPNGVTCPMEGAPVFGCRGLTTPDARRLGANVVLYANWRKAIDTKR